jgi:hypothetical protein
MRSSRGKHVKEFSTIAKVILTLSVAICAASCAVDGKNNTSQYTGPFMIHHIGGGRH